MTPPSSRKSTSQSRLESISSQIQLSSSKMGGGITEQLQNVLIILPILEPTRELEEMRKRWPQLNIKFIHFRGGPSNRTIDSTAHEASIWKDVDVLITLSALPQDHKRDAPRLKLVHFYSAGTDTAIGNPLYEDPNIIITTSSGVHGPQISEWVIMTGLIHSHHYDTLHEAQSKHRWVPLGSMDGARMDKIHDNAERRMGIMGYGSIGRQIGRVAKAMGMEVCVYTATPKRTSESREDNGYIVPGTGDPKGELPDEWYSGLDKPNLHHFLRQNIDWLVISLPLTKDTRHLFTEEEFRIMAQQKAPFISNISRGQIIKQDDLIKALHEGTVSGAALDVAEPEPLPADDPLWEAPNLTITPHVSGLTSKYSERTFGICESNIVRWSRGEKLLNVVDRKRGY